MFRMNHGKLQLLNINLPVFFRFLDLFPRKIRNAEKPNLTGVS